MRTAVIVAGLFAALALTGTASAATKPNMHLTWTKVERAWTAAAREHGAKVDCPAWGAGNGGDERGKIVCHFTSGATTWTADFQFSAYQCSISMSFVAVAKPVGGKLLGIQKLSPCEKKWWLGVSSPWSYSAA